MAKQIEVIIPNIGDFAEVEVVEVLVAPGDTIAAEDSLITVESDKASMEIPSPAAGQVDSLKLQVGDKVSAGDVILILTGEQSAAPGPASGRPASSNSGAATPAADGSHQHFEVVVLGGGPGGYTAAFRAADLGKKVAIIERYPRLGGVCLNVGCIPSKALLHTAGIINEAADMQQHGVGFSAPEIDLDGLRSWKDSVVARLTGGLSQLAKQRKVTVIEGTGQFYSANRIDVQGAGAAQSIAFDHAIIAAGSHVAKVPGFPFDDPRVMDSTDALTLEEIPGSLLIVGGGIIGLEMATIYDALGSKVTVVELTNSLIPGCDKDLVRPLQRRISKRYEAIYLGTRVTEVKPLKKGLTVSFEGKKAPASATYDRLLVAVGRRPNGQQIRAENAGVFVDERGFIPVDKQQRTNVANIFAIGDIVGQPMLAHKAVHEGKVAAEVISGHRSAFDARAIPSVAYTDPEVAWMGLSETEAKEKGIEYEKAAFPWAASGRSLGMGRDEGMTKILFDKQHKRVLGAGIVGAHAGDLIAEAMLALEMGADAEDISLTIHPHPTLSETFAFAAEIAEGSITDLYMPKKK